MLTTKATRLSFAWKLSLLVVIGGLCVLTAPVSACGQAGNKVDGAMWRFTMTPKARGAKKVRGRFRVKDNRVYQKANQDAKQFNKLVGTFIYKRKKKRAKVTFTDLRAIDKQKNWHNGIKGTVLMKMKKLGEGAGTMVDSEGRHWNFHTTRIQE